MKVTEIIYNRRFKTGDYGHSDYTVTAEMEEGESVSEAFGVLQAEILTAENGPEKKAANPVGRPKKVKEVKEVEKAKEPVVEKVAEEAVEEVEEETVVEEEVIEEEKVEEEVKPVQKKKKGTAYNRNDETHKAIVAKQLGIIHKGWNKDPETKAKGQKASKALDGSDFLDSDGQILPSFVASLKKLMK